MQRTRTLLIAACCSALGACAGKVTYTPPSPTTVLENEITVNESIDAAWQKAVPALSKQFFVINNMDKASGLINLSYSGTPDRYIDCGWISSHVQNLRGTRDYVFPAAAGFQQYESMEGGELYFIQRRIALEGRVNLVFEAIEAGKTRVTANTKYVVTKTVNLSNSMGQNGQVVNSTSFTSNSGAAFPDAGGVYCRSTGALEQDLLKLIQ
jgi:hypothetical protein